MVDPGLSLPLFRTHLLRRLGGSLIDPRVAWLSMNAAYFGWPLPKAYEFALSSEGWHNVEHICLLLSSTQLWWPIIRPWPMRRQGPGWFLLPYLLSADIVNTALSGTLCFAGRLLYPSYGETPRPFGIDALWDQVAAGAFMWVFGSIVFLVPASVITMRLLTRGATRRQKVASR